MIQISGLTPLQRELCDRIWDMGSQEEIMAWFETLPRSVAHEAYVMMQMIIWAVIDQEPLGDLSQAQELIHKIQNQSR